MTPGDKFGKLTVLEVLTGSEAGRPREGRWCRVKCECGARKSVRAKHLRAGRIKSCGCLKLITFNGLTLNRTEWAAKLGMCSNGVSQRLMHGWPVRRAVTARRFSRKEQRAMA